MQQLVDEECRIPGAKVHKNYSCTLSQANIDKNSNKFYVMQIITDGHNYWVYHRYGRIGDRGVSGSKHCQGMDWTAIKTFCSTFYKKTGNKWGTPFKVKPNKYIMMDIEEPVVISEEIIPTDAKKIPDRTRDFIKTISSQQLLTKTLQKLNVDTKRLPLGKIKKEQLSKAEETLLTIGKYLDQDFTTNISAFGHPDPEGFRTQRLKELSSIFWTLLPYACGRNRPPTISNLEILGTCSDQLTEVRSINVSTKIIEKGTTPENIYESLSASIIPIDRDEEEFEMLSKYVTITQSPRHDKLCLLDAFSIDKKVSDPSHLFEETSNHVLLFHGSRSANFLGIFAEGLRIPINTQISNGSVLGVGIYFADCISKSFNYCQDDTGFVLVCEVALGTPEMVINTISGPIPGECQSRMAQGKLIPLEEEYEKWANDDSVTIPCGTLTTIESASTFWHNEYVIYRKEQYRFRYLLKLKMDR